MQLLSKRICRFVALRVYYTLDQNAVVAQPVERRTRNAQVKGSSPFNGSLTPAITLCLSGNQENRLNHCTVIFRLYLPSLRQSPE